MSIKNIHLIGPVSVGKGYLCNLLMQRYKKTACVDVGKSVRERLSRDDLFRIRYWPEVKAGRLLPDTPSCEIFDHERQILPAHNVFVSNGFCRSPIQVAYARYQRLLDPNDSIVFILHATKEVCIARSKIGPRGEEVRIDADTVAERYDLHYRNFPGVLNALCVIEGLRIITLDANQDIEGHVFPIMRHTLDFWGVYEPPVEKPASESVISPVLSLPSRPVQTELAVA